MCVCAQGGFTRRLVHISSQLPSTFFVFFPSSRWKIFTLLFVLCVPPPGIPVLRPGSSTACQAPSVLDLWTPLRLGVHPTALPSTKNLLLVPFFIPTSPGTPGTSGSWIKDSLQALAVPWASPACKNWMLQAMPVHPAPWEEVKSPKAESEQWDQPLSGIWALPPASMPVLEELGDCPGAMV